MNNLTQKDVGEENITNEIKSKLTENECENITNKKKWVRNCPNLLSNPDCLKELTYNCKRALNVAIKSNSKCISCGRVPDIRGKKLCNSIVIKYVGSSKWLCKCCNCGNEIIRWTTYLIKDNHLFCNKCFSITQRKLPYEAIYNRLIRSSKYRDISLNLTYEDYLELTKNEKCHYCDRELEWSEYTQNPKINLDRKNTKLGYVKENCVVCCWPCNELKGQRLSYEEMVLLRPALIQIREQRELLGGLD